MPKYHPGDIIWVRFPFEDTVQFKVRPGLVVYEDSQGEYLICPITSKDRSATIKVIGSRPTPKTEN